MRIMALNKKRILKVTLFTMLKKLVKKKLLNCSQSVLWLNWVCSFGKVTSLYFCVSSSLATFIFLFFSLNEKVRYEVMRITKPAAIQMIRFSRSKPVNPGLSVFFSMGVKYLA